MSALWQWLGSRASYRIISALAAVYISICELGRTGSWWHAIYVALLFYATWMLGRGSAAAPAPTAKTYSLQAQINDLKAASENLAGAVGTDIRQINQRLDALEVSTKDKP